MYEHTCKKDNKYIISTNSDCVVTDVETGIVLAVVLAKTQKVIQAISDSFTTSVECNIRPFVEATVDIDIIGGGEYDLPAGYKKLEYLESSGTQYVLTPVTTNQVNAVDFDFRQVGDLSRSQCMWVLGNATSENGLLFGFWSIQPQDYPEDFGYYMCESLNTPFIKTAGVLDTHADKFTRRRVSIKKMSLTLDGSIVQNRHNGSLYPNLNSDNRIALFAANHAANGIMINPGCKLWSAMFCFSGEPVAHFIPVLDETGTPCMYDKVSHQSYYNSGSGDFIIPPDEYATQTLDLDDVVYGKMTEYGIRRLYKVPAGETMSKTDYAIANGYKEIVEPPMPTDGYWTPHWRETDTQLILEWVETEPPAEEV